jgi:hypothetical protein
MTGVAGGLGSLGATIPLEAGLTHLGWGATFAVMIGVAAARLTGELTAERQREIARQPSQTPATSGASARP